MQEVLSFASIRCRAMSVHRRIRQRRQELNLTQPELAAMVGVSRSAIGNWELENAKKPSLPQRRHQQALADALKLSVAELMAFENHESAPTLRPHLLDTLTVVPEVSWDQLMRRPLPPVFKITLVDDAMVPRAGKGTIVEFTKDLEARPGDGVLVRDGAGNHYFRQYRVRAAGEWEAFALNEAYRTLDSRGAALDVVAVLTGVLTRWA